MMKTKGLFQLLCLAVLLGGFSSCLEEKCEETRTYTIYQPVLVNGDDFRHPVSAAPAEDLCEPGALYYYRDYLFIVEKGRGIHIFDNDIPAAPRAAAFLPVEGANSLAIVDDILYASQYVDLLAFDLNDPENPVFLSRTEDVFPHYGTFAQEDGRLMLTVDYLPTEETVTLTCSDPNWGQDIFWMENSIDRATVLTAAVADNAAGSESAPSGGIGGSLARFTIAMGHLYVVDEYRLLAFDLSSPAAPSMAAEIHLGWGIETIFPYGEQLFIGSRTGMYIMDNSNPLQPEQLGFYAHTNACDPVFVKDDRAYVTLRDGTECETFSNQLDVVDISDATNPQLIATYPMHHPIGLSIDGDHLFLCEDDQGLKVFDISNDLTIADNLVTRYPHVTAQDVITLRGDRVALVIGPDGLTQLDYSDITELQPLSHLQVCD